MFYAAAARRTLANATVVEGFFGAMWFGWGQESPPAWASVVLEIGAVLAVLVAVGGIVAAWRARGEPSALAGAGAGRRYGIIVAAEFGLIGLGAAMLMATGHAVFIAAWVCLGVGVHFMPLTRVFPNIGMVPLAAAVSVVGITAFVLGAMTSLAPSTVAGLGAGACLLGHGASLLTRALR